MNSKRRKLFAPGGDPRRNVHLDWLEDYTPTAMAEAFKISGDAVVKKALRDSGHPDQFFYPAMFLYRHYLELELKNLIQLGRKLEPPFIPTCDGRGHDLAALWKDARIVLTTVFSGDDPSALEPIDDAVSEMSLIDPDGQHFRYYTNLKGKRNLAAAPRVICLRRVRRVMNKVFHFLLGCSMGMSEFVSAQQCYRE